LSHFHIGSFSNNFKANCSTPLHTVCVASNNSVVKKALYLSSAEGGAHPPKVAYNLALASFYKHRVEQENDEILAKSRARELFAQKQKEYEELAAGAEAAAAAAAAAPGSTVANTIGDIPEPPQEVIHPAVKWFREQEMKEIEKDNAFVHQLNRE
jgi:hypothetical protein